MPQYFLKYTHKTENLSFTQKYLPLLCAVHSDISILLLLYPTSLKHVGCDHLN